MTQLTRAQARGRDCVVAMDALVAWDCPGGFIGQFQIPYVQRELVKAYTAFSSPCRVSGPAYQAIATGNWGCGAFAGDPQLKAIVQWLAASLASDAAEDEQEVPGSTEVKVRTGKPEPTRVTDNVLRAHEPSRLDLRYYTFNDSITAGLERLANAWRRTADIERYVSVNDVFQALKQYLHELELVRRSACNHGSSALDEIERQDLFEYLLTKTAI